MLLIILFLNLLSFNFSELTIKELNSLKWTEIGLRNICPLEDFQLQLNKIKHEFKKCLHFKHILIDIDLNILDTTSSNQDDLDDLEEEKEIQKHFTSISYSKNRALNPFCKLSKYWNDCIKIILPLNCLEPNLKSLVPAFIPRTVHEQLRKIYDKHSKQLRLIQQVDSWEKNPHSGDQKLINHDDEMRNDYHNRLRLLKFEQLSDYFKFRCDQRVQLHIDSLDLDEIPKRNGAPPIDRFEQEAFADF